MGISRVQSRNSFSRIQNLPKEAARIFTIGAILSIFSWLSGTSELERVQKDVRGLNTAYRFKQFICAQGKDDTLMTLGFLHDSFKAQFDTLGKGGRMARTIDDSRSFLTYIKVLFKHVETSDNATSFPGWNQLVSEIIKYESLQKTLEPLMEDRLINKQSQSFPMPSASAPVKV